MSADAATGATSMWTALAGAGLAACVPRILARSSGYGWPMSDPRKSSVMQHKTELQPHDEIMRIADGESAIRVIREHRGIKPRDFARMVGLTPAQLERYEKGRSAPRADRLRRIADVLEVNVIDLRTCHENFASCAKLMRYVDED